MVVIVVITHVQYIYSSDVMCTMCGLEKQLKLAVCEGHFD